MDNTIQSLRFTQKTNLRKVVPEVARLKLNIHGYLHTTPMELDDAVAYCEKHFDIEIIPQAGGKRITAVKTTSKGANLSGANGKGPVSLHTDGPYLERSIDYLSLYAHNKGSFGTPTLLYDMREFVPEQSDEVLNMFCSKQVLWTNRYTPESTNAPIISVQENQPIVRYSRNALLLKNSSPTLEESELGYMNHVCSDGDYMMAALLDQWADNPQNTLTCQLETGEFVIFNNTIMLHRVKHKKCHQRKLGRVFFSKKLRNSIKTNLLSAREQA